MKRRLIELLAYPRALVRDRIDLETCPHAGYYDREDGRCVHCDARPECAWLNRNDEFVALERKSIGELLPALAFAMDVVNIHVARGEHDPSSCGCESCRWLREATEIHEGLLGSA